MSLLPSRPWMHLGLVVALALGIAGFLQSIAERHSRRFDFTPSQSLSLSEVSRKALAELREPIEVTAFTSRDDKAKVAEVMDLFRGASPNFRYELLDLDRNPGRARQEGVDRYGKAAVRYHGRRVVVDADREPAIGAGLALLARGRPTRVVFLTGHGERSPAEMTAPVGYGQLRQALEQASYEVGSMNLLKSGEVSNGTDLLIVAGPKKDLLDAEAEAMERYLAGGGHAMLLVDPVPLPNLGRLAVRHGIDTPPDVIVDRSNQLFASDPLTVPIPIYLPHPITASSRMPALFAVARPVVAEKAPSGASAALVAASDPEAWAIRDFGRALKQGEGPRVGEDRRGPVGVMAAASWPATNGEARLVVAGDSDFASNSLLDLLGNRDLVLNAIGWSVSAGERIGAHPPSEVMTLRPLSPFVLSTRAGHAIFVALVVVEPALVLAFGTTLSLRRRSRGVGGCVMDRSRWSRPSYSIDGSYRASDRASDLVSSRRTVVLGAVLVVLGVYFVLFERFSLTQLEAPPAARARILDCDGQPPAELSVAASGGTISARRDGEKWATSAGGFAPGAFADLGEALCRLPILDRIGPPARLEDFGLGPAAAEIRVVIGGRERRLRIGASTPGDNLMYVKFADEADVLKIGVELRSNVDRVSAFAAGSP